MGKNRFRQQVRDYFSFTRAERNGMRVMGLLLVVALFLNIIADKVKVKYSFGEDEARAFLEGISPGMLPDNRQLTLFEFDPNTITSEALDSLALPRQIRQNLLRYRSGGGRFRTAQDMRRLYGMNDTIMELITPYVRITGYRAGRSNTGRTGVWNEHQQTRAGGEWTQFRAVQPERFGFDPSMVSDEELRRLGFSDFQRRNLLNFRSRGGRFKKKEDLLKIYGIDSAFYSEIEELITIEGLAGDTGREPIELNHADSALLTTLPGIGPAFAGRIIRYRKSLGGFSNLSQLMEVYGMSEERFLGVAPYIWVDSLQIVPLRLNFADNQLLARHPYVGRELALNIVNLRSKMGPFQSQGQILENQLVDSTTFKKLLPYLSCK